MRLSSAEQMNKQSLMIWMMSLGTLAGCATPIKPRVQASASPPAALIEGERKLLQGDAAGALEIFERFGAERAAAPWSQMAEYDAGRALESLSRWSDAAEKYRAVAQVAESSAPRLQALALYRLSFCAEALGQDDVALAALRDVESRRSRLPPEIADAEFPARVAGAYARIGNIEAAVSYYAQAERGIARLRHSPNQSLAGKTSLEWIPRTLYQMGRASLRKPSWDDFETSVRPLRFGQIYLLQAAETGVLPWAERASQDLSSAYADLLVAISSAPVSPPEDPVTARRESQRRAWDYAHLTLEAIEELRARRLPADRSSSNEANAIFKYIDGAETNLKELLSKHPAGDSSLPRSRAQLKKIKKKRSALPEKPEVSQ